ncbi:hypothetical protein ABEB36_006492 [Hypothenemus hampei]|uniref:FAST kinase leucine-rich domain-containing protein n=1 Tax=Hypothenemus hampei TaxID=57062 RepID=A0ABD1EQQ6_HYPHA
MNKYRLASRIWRLPVNYHRFFRALYTVDAIKPIVPDNLLENIKNSQSTFHILQMVNENYKEMNERHSVQALKMLFFLQKQENCTMSTKKLVSHPVFEKICRNIKKNSGIVDLNDAVDVLKSLSFLGIPSTSTITQVMLQIVRSNVNSLSIPQILFLDYLLTTFQVTPLVEAMKIALPMVFEIVLPTKLNDSSVTQMADCLKYAVFNNLSYSTIEFLTQKLDNFQEEFTGQVAVSILLSLCKLPRKEHYENLINKAATDLVVNIDNVPIIKLEICLNRLAHCYSKSYPFYYQEVLFDTCANYIIDHKIGYKRAITVARNMARMHHFHKKLLDYIAECVYKNGASIEKDPADIYSIAVYAILSDHRPTHWEDLKRWIMSCKDLATENRKEIIWIRFAAALCILDIYKIDVLCRALRPDYLEHLFTKNFSSDFDNYYGIWQCISTYKPDLVQLLPENINPKDLVLQRGNPNRFPLKGALEAGLGGEQFFLTNLYSKLGLVIGKVLSNQAVLSITLGNNF